jgi:hypothetical protein
MAYASETFSRWPSLALPLPPAFFTLFVLLAQIVQPGQSLALQDLAVVVAGEFDHHRGAVGECQTRVETHELKQLDGHERKLHTAVHRSVSLRRQVHIVEFTDRVLDYNNRNVTNLEIIYLNVIRPTVAICDKYIQ